MATPDQTRDYYDADADLYDRKTGFGSEGGHTYNFSRYYESFLDRAVPHSGRVLELGCGTGFYTRWPDRVATAWALLGRFSWSASLGIRSRSRPWRIAS